jgi:hypothetical protein
VGWFMDLMLVLAAWVPLAGLTLALCLDQDDEPPYSE